MKQIISARNEIVGFCQVSFTQEPDSNLAVPLEELYKLDEAECEIFLVTPISGVIHWPGCGHIVAFHLY